MNTHPALESALNMVRPPAQKRATSVETIIQISIDVTDMIVPDGIDPIYNYWLIATYDTMMKGISDIKLEAYNRYRDAVVNADTLRVGSLGSRIRELINTTDWKSIYEQSIKG